jgi:hypothetical protein
MAWTNEMKYLGVIIGSKPIYGSKKKINHSVKLIIGSGNSNPT